MTKTTLFALAALLAAPVLAQTPAAPPPAAKPEAPRIDASKVSGALALYATFETSRGKIGVRLLPGKAPKAVQNFVELAQGGKTWTDPQTGAQLKTPAYDGTLFHRVITGFMIQGGDPLTRGAPLGASATKSGRQFGTGDPGYKFQDELEAGATPFSSPCQLAMANSGPDTNGSQFFITEGTPAHLNPRSCKEARNGVCGYVHFGSGVCGCELVGAVARAGPSQTRLDRVVITTTPPHLQVAERNHMAEPLFATFQTSMGNLVIRLLPEKAPKTVENFVSLAEGTREWTHPTTGVKSKTPLYDGTIFHRVIPEFMIQGGDPAGTGTGGPGYRFADEIGPDNKFDRAGLLAMANAGPGTNGCQFFITEVPTPHLDRGHTIFGEVVKGGELVPKIARAGNKKVTLQKVTISRGAQP